MTTKKLLELRKEISARRPRFVREDSQKRIEVGGESWRRPKGMHSKMRDGLWGRPASVNVGYRGPAEVRGMHPSGLMPIVANNADQLIKIDAKTQGVIMGHVGDKKKITILTTCKQKGLTILNVKNTDEMIKKLTDNVTARKEAKKNRALAKEQKSKQKTQPKKEETATKEQERKEMEKILTKKE
ncbi:50S ribosomal protein L32e [uncultured archaeon]|nr:50S ribosomal protein L32e [uncultured archaeon]